MEESFGLITEDGINCFQDVLLGSVRLTKVGRVEELTTANWAKLNFILYGGILTLTHSQLYQYCHIPTMVGFCHGGNMPASHHFHHRHHFHHHHHHHFHHYRVLLRWVVCILCGVRA